MTRGTKGGRSFALLFLSALAFQGHAQTPPSEQSSNILVALRETGEEIARFDVPDGAEWCVLWHHSVKGFEVSDCYENRGGRMVLVWSHLPDFAAGLDHIPGRGRQISDGKGGYLILGIDEPVPGNAYVLRPGAGSVDHRLTMGDRVVSLSAVAAHERVTIALIGTKDQ